MAARTRVESRTRTTEPRFDCANVLRRTHCLVRRSSISSERDLERSFVSHSNSKGEGHGTRHATTRHVTTRRGTADDYWCSRRPASGGTSSHARTQLRLASPRPLARTHARTKRIRFPGWTHPPTSDIYIYIYTHIHIYIYIYMHIYIYIYIYTSANPCIYMHGEEGTR